MAWMYVFCKDYNPQDIPPPIGEQVDNRGRLMWTPTDVCTFARAEEPETAIGIEHEPYRIRCELDDTWDGRTRRRWARTIICQKHPTTRVQAFMRNWTVRRRNEALMHENYTLETTTPEEAGIPIDPNWLWPGFRLNYWRLNRPPATNLHTYWIPRAP